MRRTRSRGTNTPPASHIRASRTNSDRGGDFPDFERRDVVYGDDPFKDEENARPWLILSNHEGRPFHGEQYIAVTLTTKSWMDELINISEESWLQGGTPDESRIVPWGVQSIDHEDIDFWQGRLERTLVDEAVAALAEELQ